MKLQSNWGQLVMIPTFHHDSPQPRDQLMAPFLKNSVQERISLWI